MYGGRSTEHEVSVTSATTIFHGLDPSRYERVLIAIDHDGRWRVAQEADGLLPESVFGSRDIYAAYVSFDVLPGKFQQIGI